MNGDSQKQPPAADQEDANWEYKSENVTPSTSPQESPRPMSQPAGAQGESVTWTASEFVAHNKGMGWYGVLALAAGALAAVAYLLTKDVVSSAIIIIVGILFGVSATRKPRILNYKVDSSGLTIGQKFYPYAEFKSFSVMEEGAFSSIMFLPLKRFMPPINIYYDPADEDKITLVLSQHLPVEHRTHDVVDRFLGRIRF